MKLLAYILIFLVAGLTAQPILSSMYLHSSNNCCENSCEKEFNTKEKNTPTEKNCKNQNCNPFQSCCCSIGFTVKTFFYKIDSLIVKDSKIVLFAENSVSQYSSNVWQPPKVS